MQGVLGLVLLGLGALFLYDVLAGKSQTMLSLVSGQSEAATPVPGTKTGGPTPQLNTIPQSSNSSTPTKQGL